MPDETSTMHFKGESESFNNLNAMIDFIHFEFKL